jgi:hypothetical protein
MMVLDCDMIVHPDFLLRTLGHFYEPAQPGSECLRAIHLRPSAWQGSLTAPSVLLLAPLTCLIESSIAESMVALSIAFSAHSLGAQAHSPAGAQSSLCALSQGMPSHLTHAGMPHAAHGPDMLLPQALVRCGT